MVDEDPRNPFGIEVGQVWAPEAEERRWAILRVEEVVTDTDRPYARCVMIADHRPSYAARRGHQRQILLRNFKEGSRGYRRIC